MGNFSPEYFIKFFYFILIYTLYLILHFNNSIQNRVDLLNPNTLDLDMLEERVRFMMGYSRTDEVVVFRH